MRDDDSYQSRNIVVLTTDRVKRVIQRVVQECSLTFLYVTEKNKYGVVRLF